MDMKDLGLSETFSLILCPYSAFTYLLAKLEETARSRFFSGICRLLSAGGRFILDVFVPRYEILCQPDACIFFDYRRDFPGGLVRYHWKLAAERFEQLLEGEVRNTHRSSRHEDCFKAESDLLGQALRIGSILMSHGFLRGEVWKEHLSRVAEELRGYVSSAGAVAFDRREGRNRPHWNAWSAMFACQAFFFWETSLAGKPVEPRLIRLLV